MLVDNSELDSSGILEMQDIEIIIIVIVMRSVNEIRTLNEHASV